MRYVFILSLLSIVNSYKEYEEENGVIILNEA